jgi:hypothetical protein
MRLHKRATLIAKSIRKLIEDSGGTSPKLALVQVRLPVEVFDLMRENAGAPGATELRVGGIFAPDDGSSAARRKRSTHKERRM